MVISILHLLGRLPFMIRSQVGYAAGLLFGYLPLRDQKITHLQLTKMLFQNNDPDNASKKLVAKVFGHFGRVALEMINLAPALRKERSSLTIEVNQLLLEELKGRERPLLALTAHTGNWELMAAYIARQGFQLVAVAREARVAPLQTFLREERARFGVETIWRGGMTSQKELIRAFQANKTVAALIDQDTYVDGIFSPFFGMPARTPSALLELALRSQARIVTAFNVRLSTGGYRIEIEPITDGYSTREILDIYHSRLEAIIRRYPEQWVWFHKRWRTLPTGERLGSKDYEKFLTGVHANPSSKPDPNP